MATNTKITNITTTSTPVLALGTPFRTVVITNTGTAGAVWLRVGQSGDAVVGEGIWLNPASSAWLAWGSYSFDNDSVSQSIITAISSAGTNTLALYYF
jgi:hypothetical protein